MYSDVARKQGSVGINRQINRPVALNGLDARSPLSNMDSKSAIVLDNFIAFPDKVQLRPGCSNHVTGFASPVEGLWAWNGLTSQTLFATTDDGVFNATTAGAVGAAVTALTNGLTQAVNINTGAANFLVIVNATDSLQHWNGTVWTTVAAFGALNTNTISAIEVYRQRLFVIEENSMNLWYLPANSIAGAAVVYPLGAIFRRGGKLAALGTWTVDSGTGPDDNLAVVSSEGEVVIFSGSDPASLATWTLKGVYYLGKPLGGARCLYKSGGDLLLLAESGVYPIARALQVATIDKRLTVTDRIQALFSTYAAIEPDSTAWCLITQPDIPLLLVNVPGFNDGRQLAMNLQSGAWSTFSGWNALCWTRFGRLLYYGTDDAVVLALDGYTDFSASITGTLLQAYNTLSFARTKQIRMLRPIVTTDNPFSYNVGVANDFSAHPSTSTVSNSLTSFAVWGTSIWGAAYWAGASTLSEWRTVPDVYGTWKALYWQVQSGSARPSLESWDILYVAGGTF